MQLADNTWPAEALAIMESDLVAAFAYTTRFGNVLVAPVCPFGMVAAEQATVTTSVPLAFTDKLLRLAAAPQAALAFFTRAGGSSEQPGFVLVQGDATFPDAPSAADTAELAARWPRFLSTPPPAGSRMRKWAAGYYDHRVPVTIAVRRLTYWPSTDAVGTPTVCGTPRTEASAQTPAQTPPQTGTAATVAARKYAKALARCPDHVLGWIGSDGYPQLAAVSGSVDDDGVHLGRDDLPPGGRRGALLGFWGNPQLHGQGMVQCRGWLTPDSGGLLATQHQKHFGLALGSFGQDKLIPVLANTLYRKAVTRGLVRDGSLVRPTSPG